MQKSKIFMMISIITLIVVVVASTGTYAWYYWSISNDEVTNIATSVGAATVYFDAGGAINQSIRPTETKEEGIVKTIRVKSNVTNTLMFNLYLDINNIDEGLKHESFKYALYEGENIIKEGNFSPEYLASEEVVACDKNSTNHIVLLSNRVITNKETTYKLYIWIDGVNYTNPNEMQNATFNFKIHADGEGAIIREGQIPDISEIPDDEKNTFAYKLISDYYYSDKSIVTNNGILYYYDETHQLMSDMAGNVRYYGKAPNNYVYFNCETYPETNCEKWRIIGVFDGKVKLIRDANIGGFAWDYGYNKDGVSTTRINNWSDASLKTLLNGSYYNNEDNVTYYSYDYTNQVTTSKVVNFASSNLGIKNDETRNMIANSYWNLGGGSTSSIYSDRAYEIERGTTVYGGIPTSWTGKIALAYPSDYGYAGDFKYCTNVLYKYYDYEAYVAGENPSTECRENDWMYTGYWYWLLTPYSSGAELAWYVLGNGHVITGTVVGGANSVRPVLYLDSKLVTVSGTGSSSDPYRLG